MRIIPALGTTSAQNPSFNAALRLTSSAKNHLYHSNVQNTQVANLVFQKAMAKFSDKLIGKHPFAGDVFFDTISKKTKSAIPNTHSQYEMRLLDKTVDFHFDFNRINRPDMPYHNRSIEEKIEQEAEMQSNFLYNTYEYLSNI